MLELGLLMLMPSYVSAISIPPGSTSSLMRRKQEVGLAVEEVPRKTCEVYAAAERSSEVTVPNISEEELHNLEYLDIAVSYGMMWMK